MRKLSKKLEKFLRKENIYEIHGCMKGHRNDHTDRLKRFRRSGNKRLRYLLKHAAKEEVKIELIN